MKQSICFTFFFLTLFAKAQTEKQLPIFELTESQSLKDTSKLISPVYSINKQKLSARSPLNVAELMLFLPSVTLRDYGGLGGLKTVSVRGLSTAHTGFLVEDVRILNTQTGSFDLGSMPGRLLNSVSFSVGQASNTQQSAAAFNQAALFNFSIFGKVKEGISLNSGISLGSFGLLSPFVRLDFKKKRNHFFLYAEQQRQEGNYQYRSYNGALTEDKIRENGDVKSTNIWFGQKYAVNQKFLINWLFNSYLSDRGLPAADVFYSSLSHQRLKNNELNFQLNANYRLNKKVLFNFGAKAARVNTYFLDPLFFNQFGKIENDYALNDFYAFGNVSFQLNKYFKLFSSFDGSHQKLNSNRAVLGKPERQFYQWLQGIRFSNLQWNIELNNTYNIAQDQNSVLELSKRFNIFTPSFRLNRVLVSNEKIFLNATGSARKIMRLPGFNDLYFTALPNVNLKPEEVLQYQLGFNAGSTKKDKNLNWLTSIQLFYEETQNRLVVLPTQNLFVWSANNFGFVVSRGIESSGNIAYKLSEDLTLAIFGNLTVQQARDFTDAESRNYKHQLPYLPRLAYTAGINLNYNKLGFMGSYHYNGSRYVLPQNISANYLESFNQLDLAIWRNMAYKTYNFNLRFEVLNALNTQYQVIRSFPMPGINYRFSLQFNL